METAKSLEVFELLLKVVTKTIDNDAKKKKKGQRCKYFGILLGTPDASLLGNLSSGKGVMQAGHGVIRAGNGKKKDF